MANQHKGVIYILTNPAFAEYVMIGYAKNLKQRLQQLNRSEALPLAFRAYAIYEVDEELTDKELHKLIDILNPDIRSVEKFNGKMRVREFYIMSREQAYAILECIAKISGTTDRLKYVDLTGEEIAEEKLDMVRRLLGMEECDMFDVLEYLAFATTPMERIKRVELVRADYYQKQNDKKKAFLDFLMQYYVINGYKELSIESLPNLLSIHYGTLLDATRQLNMDVEQIRGTYLDFQRQLYKPLGHKTAGITLNIYQKGSNYYDNSKHITIK